LDLEVNIVAYGTSVFGNPTPRVNVVSYGAKVTRIDAVDYGAELCGSGGMATWR
jgi:hypothetical protein